MKTLKFESHFIPQILSGTKTTTWRLFDDKDLKAGDVFEIIDKESGESFGRAVINTVREIELQNVQDTDYDNTHDKPATTEELYESYRKYYGLQVRPESILKIVEFSLVKSEEYVYIQPLTMKLISLNTWAGAVLEPLLKFLENHKDIDVFCLQEIYHDAEGKTEKHALRNDELNLYRRIEEVLGETHNGYFRPCKDDFYGQAMFVKKDVRVEEEGDLFIFQNPNPEGRGLHSRNMQYIRVSVAGKPTLIGNVHGLWNGQGKGDSPDRLEQSRRIQKFVSNRNEQKIILGDFNLSPDTESLSIVEKGMRNLIKEFGITSTRTSFYDKENKFADYAFVSPEVEVLDFKVLPDEVSDHAALYLEIQ